MLFCLRTRYLKVKTGISILNLTTRGAIIDFLKIGPFFTDLLILACKMSMALVTGVPNRITVLDKCCSPSVF